MLKNRAPAVPKLTRREMMILRLIFEGMSSQETADRLSIGKRTVDFHLANIYEKLRASNRMEARVNAEKLGLLPLILEAGGRRSC